jgi:hypothetical protein
VKRKKLEVIATGGWKKAIIRIFVVHPPKWAPFVKTAIYLIRDALKLTEIHNEQPVLYLT